MTWISIAALSPSAKAMLGHSKLSSTQMYTQVSARMLKQIHTATHPAAQLHSRQTAANKEENPQERAELLAALAAEAKEEKED